MVDRPPPRKRLAAPSATHNQAANLPTPGLSTDGSQQTALDDTLPLLQVRTLTQKGTYTLPGHEKGRPPADDSRRSRPASAVCDSLELIDKGCASECHPVPLLFVHGAWHAAWCWDEYFLNFFAEKGYRALAVSLRGHGSSPTSKPLRTCSVADYVEDVRLVADSLPRRPALIGHSMGGLIVQKYLESRAAPAGVLMASTPPQGFLGSGMRWIKRHPWQFTKISITGKSLAYVNTPQLARERFFSAHTPDSRVVNYAARLQEESARSGVDGLLNLPRPRHVTTTLLVLGACNDGSVTPKEVRATARAYHTEAEFFPNMGHDMMLETGWAAVAERIHTWLGAHGL